MKEGSFATAGNEEPVVLRIRREDSGSLLDTSSYWSTRLPLGAFCEGRFVSDILLETQTSQAFVESSQSSPHPFPGVPLVTSAIHK